MGEIYQYKWSFGDGDKITEILDTNTGTKGKVPLSFISDCYACIISNGTIVTECKAEKLTLKGQSGNNHFTDFITALTKQIIEITFQGRSDQEKEAGKKEIDKMLGGTSTSLTGSTQTQNSEELSRKFFTICTNKLFENQSLKGSYFTFNRKQSSQDTSMNDSDNQPNDAEDDVQALIKKAIEASIESGKKCVIFTGAPGTGKTYCVERYIKNKDEDKMEGFEKSEYFVQFHSSYDYTDFMEGLRPIRGKNGKMDFVRMDGTFKAFCRKVVDQKRKSSNQETGTTEETPSQDGEETSGKNMYYYFVIDEINRADLGRVFGELMYCFEKRGEKIATQYENLPVYNKKGKLIKVDCFQGGFYIPEDVVIIGTMNDIDRSVDTFDFALRRRFDWVEIEADEIMESSLVSMQVPVDIVSQIKKMNEIIERRRDLGKDFKIGPAYFKNYNGKNLKDIWEHNIEPILREYVRGKQDAKAFIKEIKAVLLSNV